MNKNIINLYIGPFLKIQKQTITFTTDNCRNKLLCKNPTGKFCSNCGIDLSKRFVKEKRNFIDLYNLIGDDSLVILKHTENIEIIVPNEFRNNPRQFNFSYIENIIEIDQKLIQNEIAWMNENYKQKINMLNNNNIKTESSWGFFECD